MESGPADRESLNICLLLVGTRGDVQPFLPMALLMKKQGHNVRVATHAMFRGFVESYGLGFYPLGGDPKILAEFMSATRGTAKAVSLWTRITVEVPKVKKVLSDIFESLLPACTQPDPGPVSEDANQDANGDAREDASEERKHQRPGFHADMIITNPQSLGYTHVAEKLNIPVFVVLVYPTAPTSAWPYVMAPLKSIAGFPLSNLMTYSLSDRIRWHGTKDILNSWRVKSLGLPPITYADNLRRNDPSNVPEVCVWSSALAPKPPEWSEKTEVVGFCFQPSPDYRPSPDLETFLATGTKPIIYFGFGSMPLPDGEGMTATIKALVSKGKVRAIVQSGWGGLGKGCESTEDLFLVGDCPHDWLFQHCTALVHHGGAGTAGAGLRFGRPTTSVPIFGDQMFWAKMVENAGVGPPPIYPNDFNLERLEAAVDFMLRPEVRDAAARIAQKLSEEDGASGAVEFFMRNFRQHRSPKTPSAS